MIDTVDQKIIDALECALDNEEPALLARLRDIIDMRTSFNYKMIDLKNYLSANKIDL